MGRTRLLILAPLAIWLAACADPRATSTPTSPASGTARITQTEDMSVGAYIEGYVGSARVTDATGSEVFAVEVPYGDTLTRELGPGTYELAFDVRPCDANCGM